MPCCSGPCPGRLMSVVTTVILCGCTSEKPRSMGFAMSPLAGAPMRSRWSECSQLLFCLWANLSCLIFWLFPSCKCAPAQRCYAHQCLSTCTHHQICSAFCNVFTYMLCQNAHGNHTESKIGCDAHAASTTCRLTNFLHNEWPENGCDQEFNYLSADIHN